LLFEIAASVVLERSLAIAELAQVNPTLIPKLDSRATSAPPAIPATGPGFAYFKQLSGTAATPTSLMPYGAPISIPGRVATILADRTDAEITALLAGDLELSVAWEVAALLQAKTIAEWAAWEALKEGRF
jgi:hypothetical protein